MVPLWMPLALSACSQAPQETGDSDADTAIFDPYPLDDRLRFNHLTALGTHNSYHVQTAAVDAWQYTHAPLGEQLGQQGVRQFELDVYWNGATFDVFHVPVIDEGTTCATLVLCLQDMKDWSDLHPRHHPLMTLIEVKGLAPGDDAQAQLAALEAEVLSVWGADRLIVPDDLRGPAADLPTAIAEQGWPTLGALRGRALFVLHEAQWVGVYTADAPAAQGKVLFPDAYGDIARPYAAVHTMNDPFDPDIASVVGAGHLVRTRADSDTTEPRAGDTTKRDKALSSGAHWISTDFPVPAPWHDYVVEVPSGTPSGCNPLTAPPECTPQAVEVGVTP